MSDKPKRPKYRVVAVSDGTYTVEVSDGTGVITKKKGFLIMANADAWSTSKSELSRPRRESDPLLSPRSDRPRLARKPQQERRKCLHRPPWRLVHHRSPRPAHDRGCAGNRPILD